MKKLFRFSSMILVLLINLLMLPGCNSTKGDPQSQKNESSVKKRTTPVALEIWAPLSPNSLKSYSSLDDHKIVKDIESKLVVDLKFIHPTGAAGEQLSLMLASGTYPDLIKNNFNSYKGGAEAAINDGILINVNDYIDKNAPNFKKIIGANPEINKEVRSDSGKIIKFGAVLPDKEVLGLPFYGTIIRKDLLDQLNLGIPETIDDWYVVLKAFKDKLGLETPFAFPGLAYMNGAFTGAYGVPANGFYQEKGKVQFGPIQPGFKAFLTTFNKWYQEGLIAKDYNSIKIADVTKRVTAGAVGAFAGHNTHFENLYTAVGKKQDFVLAAAPIPTLKKGEKTNFRHFNDVVTKDPIYITTACKQPDVAVEFVDYLYSDEGRRLLTWGMEGEGHKIVNGKPAFSDLVTKNPDGLNLAEAKAKYALPELTTIFDWNEQLEQYALPEQHEAWKVWSNSATYSGYLPKGLTLTLEESEKLSEIMSEINALANQMTNKFIQGSEPLSNYDAFVQQIKKMGIDEALKIQQAALDRYNKK